MVDSELRCLLSPAHGVLSCSRMVWAAEKKPRDSREVGRGFRMGNTCTPMAEFM